MNLKKNRNGLTLLEVLVAVFILAIVAGPLLGIFVNNTTLLRRSYEKTSDTYDARTLLEQYYPYGYAGLFQQDTHGTPRPFGANGKHYTLDVSPAGPSGFVAGTPCYFHLIIPATGSGSFFGPSLSGMHYGDALPAVPAASLAGLTLNTTDTTYELSDTSGVIASGAKPSGAVPVLLVNMNATADLHIAMSNTSGALLVYAPVSYKGNKIFTNVSKQLFNNDAPPASMVVRAILKTYAADSTQESVYQTMLSVKLP